MGSPAFLAACRAATSSSSYGVRGRGPWPPASSARARKPVSVSSRARPDIAGWCRCCPPPCPSRTTGVPGAVCSGAQRTAVTSPSTSSRVVTPSDVVCEIRRRSAGFRSVMGVPLTRKDGAPGGYQAAQPVTEPGSTRDGTTVLLTGLTSLARVTVRGHDTGRHGAFARSGRGPGPSPGSGGWAVVAAVTVENLGLVFVPGGGGAVGVEHDGPAVAVDLDLVVEPAEQGAVPDGGLAAVGLVPQVVDLAA